MSYQKIKPCPICGCKNLGVYTYDSGWRYVECDSGNSCWYRGPGEGSIGAAIKSHNMTAAPTSRLDCQSGQSGSVADEGAGE